MLPDGVSFEVIESVLYININDVGKASFKVDAYGNLRGVDPPANRKGGFRYRNSHRQTEMLCDVGEQKIKP